MEPLKDVIRNIEIKKGTTRTSSNAEQDPIPVCPHCDGMGYVTRDVPVGHPDFGKALPCICQRDAAAQRREHRLHKVSNLAAYRHFTFENFHLDPPGLMPDQHATLQRSYEMAYYFSTQPHGWLLIHGGYGCGKTHLAAAVGNRLLDEGHAVIFVTVPDLLDHLRATYSPSSEVSYDELFDRVRNTPVLILDDMGTESPTPWASEKLFQLLNHRYVQKLPTLITTNHYLDELDGRIYSRLLDENLIRGIKMDLPDFRRGAVEDSGELSSFRLYSHLTFQTFEMRQGVITPNQAQSLQAALETAYAYAKKPEGWLVIYGVHGCGKTHLAAAIGNHIRAAGPTVMMLTTANLMDSLRSAFNDTRRSTQDRRFQEIRTAPLLIIDDFHTRSATAWAEEKLFQILDYRYLAHLPTVITILEDNMSQLDHRFMSRFSDRRLCTSIKITAPDYKGGFSLRRR